MHIGRNSSERAPFNMREQCEYVLFQSLKRFVLFLPLHYARRLGMLIGIAAYHLISARRHVALENLFHAFPEKSRKECEKIARRAFQNYGIAMMEFLSFPKLDDRTLRTLVHVRNPEVMIAGHAQGKGMVMLSGHFGNWELIAFAVAWMTGLPFTIIVQTQSNKSVDRVINELRCSRGNRVIPMGMSVREILKSLQSGGIIAIAPDQSGPMEGVFVDFFGRSVATHQGPATFALRMGAPMQFGFMIRQEDGSYEVILEEVPSADLVGDTKEHITELTQRHTAMLERYIRQYPDHWLWMHRRWKNTRESMHTEKTAIV